MDYVLINLTGYLTALGVEPSKVLLILTAAFKLVTYASLI